MQMKKKTALIVILTLVGAVVLAAVFYYALVGLLVAAPQLDIAYKNAPAAYNAILDTLAEEIAGRQGEPLDLEASGYAVIDINKDGIPELLLLADEPEGFALCAIYTLVNDLPVKLGEYWSRNRGYLAEDGIIYNIASNGADYTQLRTYQLEPGASELTLLASYTKEDENFYELWDRYEPLANQMALEFIPIGQ